MKNKTHFVIVFAIGVVFGFLVYGSLVESQSPQSAPVKSWKETEEDTRARMFTFQDRLEKLMQPNPNNVDTLSKEMEAQRGIYDILSKYREAQQAKLVSLQTLLGNGITAVIAAVVALGTTVVTHHWATRQALGRPQG